MNSLIIESSTDAASVALRSKGQIISEHIVGQRRHNDVILPQVQGLCEQANIKPSALEQVVFGSGPGSFTGTRIGTSIAQGIAVAANAQLNALSSFQILAQGIHKIFEIDAIIIAFDARKDEIYCGKYELKNGLMTGEATLTKPSELIIPEHKTWHATGDAWFKLFEQMPEQDNLIFERNIQNWLPRAEDGFDLMDRQQLQAPEITYLRSACDWKKWTPK